MGQYRVYYQAKGFGEGKTVTAKVWRSDGQAEQTEAFDELGDGLYKLDYEYLSPGRYLWLLFEDGRKTTSTILPLGSSGNPAGNDPPGDDPMSDTLVVSVSDAKAHMRVTSSADDSYIESLILAVQAYGASWQGRTWLQATLTQYFDAFPAIMQLRYPPLSSVTKIEYVDENGTTQTLSSAVYRVDTDSEPCRITEAYSQTWPATRAVTNAVIVTYVAGYATASVIPQMWKQATLLGVAHLYEHRTAVTDIGKQGMLPMGFYDLLWPDRCIY